MDLLATLLRGPWGLLLVAALLLGEELGLPILLPGSVLVMLLGANLGSRGLASITATVALLSVAVCAGSSGLFWFVRRRGRWSASAWLQHRRAARFEALATKWGPLAVLLGRHFPGARIPLTLAAAVLGV